MFLSKTACLVALPGLKIPSRPGCRNFSKCDDRKGLNSISRDLMRTNSITDMKTKLSTLNGENSKQITEQAAS
jgi:hypothetical protein